MLKPAARRPCTRALNLSLLVAAALVWVAVAPRLAAQQATGPEQQTVLTLTNQDRAGEGLTPLAWDPSLAAAATAHAEATAAAGTLSHQYPGEPDVAARASGAGARFSAVAENIAFGPDARSIEREWMHSTPHRTNILDPRMNAVGIGVVRRGGWVYAVEDFAAELPMLSPAVVEATVAAVLTADGRLAGASVDEQAAARAACPQFEGGAGAHARFVVRWEGADLRTLPQPLADAVASGQYTHAAVGACPAANVRNRGFTAYRVAVLLF